MAVYFLLFFFFRKHPAPMTMSLKFLFEAGLWVGKREGKDAGHGLAVHEFAKVRLAGEPYMKNGIYLAIKLYNIV